MVLPSSAKPALEITFEATGQSAGILVKGKANVLIFDGDATVQVERSFDGGDTYHVVSKNSDGDAMAYSTSSDSVAFNGVIEEPETGVLYRFNCTAHTNDVTCRLSQ